MKLKNVGIVVMLINLGTSIVDLIKSKRLEKKDEAAKGKK